MASSDGSSSGTGSSSTGGASGASSSSSAGGTAGDSNGSSSSTGGDSTNGSTTGGGGSGGLGDRECRTVADCDAEDPTGSSSTRCASPFEPSGDTIVCGAPGWCGNCDCPVQAPGPEGQGYACETDEDCFAWGDTPNAALCREGQCVVCETDDDCSSELPHCAPARADFSAYYDTCLQCVLDEDCTESLPHCVYVDGVGPSCVECVSTSDCETGVCSQNTCIVGCTSDDECSDPATGCLSSARCGPMPCAMDDECPDNTSCSDQTCRRRACSEDADCEGVCVNGVCHERFGSCSTTYFAP